MVGLEIDPARVGAALPLARPGVTFGHGGFELGGSVAGRSPVVVRAANVLRQYAEQDVDAAWRTMTARLGPGGLLVDVACDELGRRAAWVAVAADGPVSLTVSLTVSLGLAGLVAPSGVAERLPKALIHRNVPGEPVHTFLRALDDAWARQAPLASFGVRQRWVAACRAVREEGWPLLGGPTRWRLGEVTVAYDAVAPLPR